MTEENELVFLEPEDIPRLLRGKTGRDWSELFDKIPEKKVLFMDTETYGSASTIRIQVKHYNENAKKKVLKVTQRTDKKTEKAPMYVMRL